MPEKDFNEVFSSKLRYYLHTYQMTQAELAHKLGVGTTTVSDWVNGRKSPRMSKIDAMCEIFDCKRSDFMEDPTDPDALTAKDQRDIAKDLDNMMEMLDSGHEGPIRYNGEEIDEESRVLLRNALELGLTQLKKENKKLYTPKKYKK